MSIRPVEEIDGKVPIRNVFVSVFGKDRLPFLIRGLLTKASYLERIFASGGTYDAIAGLVGEEFSRKHLFRVSEYTGQREIAGGLVKTIHHKIALGHLTETYCEDHQKALAETNSLSLDLAVLNFYPFENVLSNPKATPEIIRGNIDIGGSFNVRAAAKNFLREMVLAEEGGYEEFLENLFLNGGKTTFGMRKKAAAVAFRISAEYDDLIWRYLDRTPDQEFLDCYPRIHEEAA